MAGDRFDGFPASGAATVVPNLAFSRVFPALRSPAALLAFLWAGKLAQQRRAPAPYATEDEIWADEGAQGAFETLAGGREGLSRGLEECLEARALLSLRVGTESGGQVCYFVNNPGSRRAIGRIQAGELRIAPNALPRADIRPRTVPDVFRLYEEHFGTITPFVAERLADIAERFSPAWIEQAVREAALVQARNWRYVERILERWEKEGRTDEEAGSGSLESQKRRYLGGRFGHIARYH